MGSGYHENQKEFNKMCKVCEPIQNHWRSVRGQRSGDVFINNSKIHELDMMTDEGEALLHNKNSHWLPKIDDIVIMIEDKYTRIREFVADFNDWNGEHEDTWDCSMNMLMLMFYMNLKHGQEWDWMESKWVCINPNGVT